MSSRRHGERQFTAENAEYAEKYIDSSKLSKLSGICDLCGENTFFLSSFKERM